MKLKFDSMIYNSERTRNQALKEVRKPIKDSLRKERAKRKIFKVKHADNDILFNNPNDPNRNVGGHYTLTVGINPNTDDVAVAIITSLEDRDGNPTKQEQIERGLIYPLEHVDGLSRRSGIKQEVVTKNKFTNENIHYDSLQDIINEISIDEREKTYISEFLYSNQSHIRNSERNKRRTRNYIKIK